MSLSFYAVFLAVFLTLLGRNQEWIGTSIEEIDRHRGNKQPNAQHEKTAMRNLMQEYQ
jgi:hypothetical protein